MKKRMISVFLALLIFFTSINFEIAEAAEMPEPYQYWAVSISSYAETLGGGLSFKLGKGSNLTTPNDMYVFDGYPFNKDIPVIVNSNATPGTEYQNFDDATLLTYEDYMMKTDQVPANKDSSFRDMDYLTTTNRGGQSIPISNFSYLGGSRYSLDLNFPDKDTMFLCIPFEEKDGTTDGTRRIYRFYVTYVLEIHHDKFDPVTGEWDIESKVDALLNMSKETPAVWNYKDFDNGYSTEYEVYMDASASSSARPGEEYTFDMGVNVGGDVDYRNEKTVSSSKYVLSGDIFPDEITGTVKRNGSFRVDGTVTVIDDKGVSDSAYSYTDIDYEITNSSPMALSKTTDKATTSDKYLYAKREIVIKDQSIDFEGHMMDTLYKIFDGENEIASWKYIKDSKNGTWRVESQNKSDEYISSMSVNATDLTNTIVFNKSGNFRLYHMVGDIRNHSIVSQKTDVRTSALNIRAEAAAPVADFSYILNGKATDYTYPNIPVTLQDKSTDANDDITKWEWTKYNGSKEEGQTGATAVFPSEGTYNTTLKVTDFLGMTDSITKPIQVLPPIPKAEITTNDDESLMKKNRRIVISSEDSFAPPSDPIQWDKTKWKIEPLDGQSSLSIKISNLLSDSKKKAVVFKETGRYKVTIDLENNYSSANPSHPRISLKTTSIIIEIKEDIKPEPEFELTGNSPNFHDNPTSTVARVTNTSISPDNDYLDIFPGIGLEDPNNFFGRGQNVFEMEIRKDLNEDGIFASNEVYGNFTGKSLDIPVFFKEGEGSDYQATLKIRETFGQPTIKEFVTDEDRVTNVLVKKFSINWIPDIVFDIPDWAYPDDTLTFATQIKDEKPDITNVVWSVQKKNSFGVYQNIDINDASINSLTRNGGNIQFKESGYYILKADITDEKGQTSSFQDEIRIYPLPTAIITDNPAYRFDNTGSPAEFNAKQNRTYEFLGNTSHINDPYGSGIHNIDYSKDYFEIIPTSGQPVDTIKVTDGIGGLLNLTSEDSSIFKATDKQLDRELMFKLPGTYTVRYQVTNIHGKKSAFAEKTVIVHEDEKPLAEFDIQEEVLRDPTDGNKAAITMYNIKLSSIDRDNISLERVRYRFDSNNDGNFEEEAWINTDIDKINPFNWKVEVKESHVGKYEFELYTEESYGQATINRYITESDKRSNIMTKVCEIDNQAPTADFSMYSARKIDIFIAVTDEYMFNIDDITRDATDYLKRELLNNSTLPDIKIINISRSKSLSSLINSTKWRDGSTKFLIAFDNTGELIGYTGENLDNTRYLSLLNALQENKIYYIGAGPNEIKLKVEKVIKDNEYRGLYIPLDVKPDVIDISSGAMAFAYKSDNTVWSWGTGAVNEMIYGNIYPTRILNLDGAIDIQATSTQKVALKKDGSVWAWGWNPNGQVGDGTYETRYSPVKLHTLNNIVQIETGDRASAALRSDGTVWTWGYDWNEQLGNGDLSSSPVPIQVSLPVTIKKIFMGSYAVFALGNNDVLYGWGSNSNGQVGDGTRNNVKSPKIIAYNVKDVITSSNSTIAVKTDGTVWSWGYNIYGQLGVGDKVDRLWPTQITNLNNVRKIVGSEYTKFAIKEDGTTWSWGSGSKGAMGDGTEVDKLIPVNNPNLAGFTDIGSTGSIGLKEDGSVWTWGPNVYGRLGIGVTNENYYVTTPVRVPIDGRAKKVIGSSYNNYVLRSDGVVFAWGQNSSGMVGNGESGMWLKVYSPTQVINISDGMYTTKMKNAIYNTIVSSTNFIISLIPPITALVNYILLDTDFNYSINYSDFENDPQMNINNWKYDHDSSYFENSLGRISNNNQWLSSSINKFDKVGKYIVEYRTKDNPVGGDDRFDNYRKWSIMPSGPMTLYVHRKPVAKMKTVITRTPTSITANITSLGYDLDHMSLPDNGIRAWEWSYKEVGSSTWVNAWNGKSFSFPGHMSADYFVRHRVQDTDGANGIGVWSDENIILVTTKPMPPVADFDVTPSPYPIRSNLNITDLSYDPNGDLIHEYVWNLYDQHGNHRYSKGIGNAAGVTQSQINVIASEIKNTIDSQGHAAYGDWKLTLQVRDSSGDWSNPLAVSEIASKTITVVPNNAPPVINSLDPTDVFVDGRNSLDSDNISNPLNNFINWNFAYSDPDGDSISFNWKLEHHIGQDNKMLKSTYDIKDSNIITERSYSKNVPSSAAPTFNPLSVPFSNTSFESQLLPPGPYKLTLNANDIPAYGESQNIASPVVKSFYIIPKVTGVPYVILEEGKEEIICGDTVTLRIITDEITTGITAQAEGSTATLSFVSKQGSQYIWETSFVIPEIEDSGNMDITFTLKTDFGSKDAFGTDGQTTRIKTLKETIYVTALKLEDFRVTDLVKHSQYKDLYPLRRSDFTLDYIAGYYCTFQINAKGNPDRVFADVSHNTSEVGTVELKKVGDSGTYGVWEGKYFAPFDTPRNTVVSFDLEASKGTTKYNYNEKESWNGKTLKVTDSILKDAVIARTN